jgi:hypothetical protein
MFNFSRVADLDPYYFGKLDPDPHSSKNSGAVQAQYGAKEGRGREGSKWSPGRSESKSVVADTYNFDEERDPDPH